MVNPNATALLGAGMFPSTGLANVSDGVGTFRGGSGVPRDLKEEVVRIDHNFTSRFSVFGPFVAEQISQGYATAQWSGDNLPTVGDTFGNPSYSGVIHTTYTINPSLINEDRKSTRLNSSHGYISYAVFCLKKKKKLNNHVITTSFIAGGRGEDQGVYILVGQLSGVIADSSTASRVLSELTGVTVRLALSS